MEVAQGYTNNHYPISATYYERRGGGGPRVETNFPHLLPTAGARRLLLNPFALAMKEKAGRANISYQQMILSNSISIDTPLSCLAKNLEMVGSR